MSTMIDFLSSDFFDDGVRNIRRILARMSQNSFADNNWFADIHPLQLSWFRYIEDGRLPVDMISAGGSRVNKIALDTHRLLTVEYLLNNHSARWPDGLKDDVRAKLKNPSQFANTLYELEVLDCFRRSEYDVDLVEPGENRSADIGGVVLGVNSSIECKQVGHASGAARDRRDQWSRICEGLLSDLERLGKTATVSVALMGELDEATVDSVTSCLSDWKNCPPWVRLDKWEGRVILELESRYPDSKLSPNTNQFDHLVMSGNDVVAFKEETGEYLGRAPDEMRADAAMFGVGIVDLTPRNWAEETRRSLRSAISQMQHGDLNLVCIEVSDLRESTSPQPIQTVIRAAQDFLDNDTTRVSGVILTITGAHERKPGEWVTAGTSWLLGNRRASVPIPPDFKTPDFNYERIAVRVSSGGIAIAT